ncbi:unnamed protein product [Ambrosiozyma monospora]|uniref:Unnamed protein product n=1 Tax=Ambrosiozyma monospora TaxID=43982 RepID=A0ACB5T4I6_AMBMO|nr:unnamed protein product [Ambrosiozyma monospora]
MTLPFLENEDLAAAIRFKLGVSHKNFFQDFKLIADPEQCVMDSNKFILDKRTLDQVKELSFVTNTNVVFLSPEDIPAPVNNFKITSKFEEWKKFSTIIASPSPDPTPRMIELGILSQKDLKSKKIEYECIADISELMEDW